MEDGTFPVLLKCLSDPSSEVIKCDLQLLAQISSSSDDSYFTSFMVNLLELFSTDRRLLETRGSLIIRQLCLDLNAERIYRTLAEILEREEDLEFAASMVQKCAALRPHLLPLRPRLTPASAPFAQAQHHPYHERRAAGLPQAPQEPGLQGASRGRPMPVALTG